MDAKLQVREIIDARTPDCDSLLDAISHEEAAGTRLLVLRYAHSSTGLGARCQDLEATSECNALSAPRLLQAITALHKYG